MGYSDKSKIKKKNKKEKQKTNEQYAYLTSPFHTPIPLLKIKSLIEETWDLVSTYLCVRTFETFALSHLLLLAQRYYYIIKGI